MSRLFPFLLLTTSLLFSACNKDEESNTTAGIAQDGKARNIDDFDADFNWGNIDAGDKVDQHRLINSLSSNLVKTLFGKEDYADIAIDQMALAIAKDLKTSDSINADTTSADVIAKFVLATEAAFSAAFVSGTYNKDQFDADIDVVIEASPDATVSDEESIGDIASGIDSEDTATALALVDYDEARKQELLLFLLLVGDSTSKELSDLSINRDMGLYGVSVLSAPTLEMIDSILGGVSQALNRSAILKGTTADRLDSIPEVYALMLDGIVTKFESDLTVDAASALFTEDDVNDFVATTSEKAILAFSTKGVVSWEKASENMIKHFDDNSFAQKAMISGLVAAGKNNSAIDSTKVAKAILVGASESEVLAEVTADLAETMFNAGISGYDVLIKEILIEVATADNQAKIDAALLETTFVPVESDSTIVITDEFPPYEPDGTFDTDGELIGSTLYIASASVSIAISGIDDAEMMSFAESEDDCIASTSYVAYLDSATMILTNLNAATTIYAKFQNSDLVSSTCELIETIVHDDTGPTVTGGGAITNSADAASASLAPSASWSEFEDAGSGHAGYKIAVFTSGGSLVKAYADIGDVLTYQVDDLSLSIGDQHIIRVKAYDELGNESEELLGDIAFALQSYITKTYNDSGAPLDFDDTYYKAGRDMDLVVQTGAKAGTVLDNITGLVWQEVSGTSGTYGSNALAEAYCGTLSTAALGGYTGWRLPTQSEFMTILTFGAHSKGYDDSIFDISNDGPGTYRRTNTGYGSSVLGVDLNYGYILNRSNTEAHYAHCVTGKTSPPADTEVTIPAPDITANGDNTLSDASTGLIWTDDVFTAMKYSDSIAHCDGLTQGGESDWRLPSIKELATLVVEDGDLSAEETVDHTDAFSANVDNKLINSSTMGLNIGTSHFFQLQLGAGAHITINSVDTTTYYHLCVRGGVIDPPE